MMPPNLFSKRHWLSLEQGDTISVGTACINLSWAAVTKGEWELAISRGEEGIA
jgi:hypothetical protein